MRVSLTTIFSSVLCTVLVSSQDLNTAKCVDSYGIPSAESEPGSFINTDCTNDGGAHGAINVAVNKLGIGNVYGVTKQVVAGINYVVFLTSDERTYRVPVYEDLEGNYSLQEDSICYDGLPSAVVTKRACDQ
ncbi:hypothetical protein BDV38DRAFT_286763 [Aspergillus pseudotamarii]|uniref:Uncharacterized protein n=1 Tax=Aspergillus pseudotamarii TaxID=132259 RepID=A0A5N6SFI6_ASPPS|nr:uncharacterized protein BDV38DRAFT_286763 [Aspergillus pseudotamarii]KAE8133432.1 hypothetical protein BDV38DRAFT_286763 [Aspergillus pseudotamarii]